MSRLMAAAAAAARERGPAGSAASRNSCPKRTVPSRGCRCRAYNRKSSNGRSSGPIGGPSNSPNFLAALEASAADTASGLAAAGSAGRERPAPPIVSHLMSGPWQQFAFDGSYAWRLRHSVKLAWIRGEERRASSSERGGSGLQNGILLQHLDETGRIWKAPLSPSQFTRRARASAWFQQAPPRPIYCVAL